MAVIFVHGGMKFYRGSPGAARTYVEQDRSRADDYYLAEGSGVADRYAASPLTEVIPAGSLTGEAYEKWVAGYDPATDVAKGRLRTDAKALRFVEVVVNGPKTWSLAAALHPEIADALDAAQTRAAEQIIGWVAEHATTRIGPKGRQVQVPVTEIEAAVVRHYTSRAGDPHRHLHLQISARVLAEGTWRGLHSVGMRDSLAAINGIGHAAVTTDPAFRAVLTAHGFTLDPASGELAELAPYVGRFSARTAQIGRNLDRYEAEWRTANPGAEPGPALRQAWDRRAWSEARPDKVVPTDGAELVTRWNEELHTLGYRDPEQVGLPLLTGSLRVAAIDRDQVAEVVLSRLGARRSAWNAADIRGEVEQWIAGTGLVADAAIRTDLAEDLTARTLATCKPLLPRTDVPEHIRALTSREVMAVEADLVTRFVGRAEQPAHVAAFADPDRDPRPDSRSDPGPDAGPDGLDVAQLAAVASLAGSAQLLVVEGAAGAGKTKTLAATQELLAERGHRMVVVTPTLKAAKVAGRETGTKAFSAAWLAHQHGWRWDDNGRWTREAATPVADAVLQRGDLLLIDEAGMLDQDTACAILTLADETQARIALVGDRHQLPAVGRGGVLDLAARWARPETVVPLDVVHRFTDPQYAELSLAMRTGVRTGDVFDALLGTHQVRLYPTEAERTQALADLAAHSRLAGETGVLVMADTREQVTALNGAIRDRLAAAGYVDDRRGVVTEAGERLGVGDRVMTRRNDRDLAVANRDTWTITGIDHDGSLTIYNREAQGGPQSLPAAYAREHVELAYATTVHGAQGETTHTGHLLLGEHTSAAAAYVAMTRGREDNVAHLVAENLDDARQQWIETFSRDRADLGPGHAAIRAAEDLERYAPHRPLQVALGDLRAAWSRQQDLRRAMAGADRQRRFMAGYGDPDYDARFQAVVEEIHEDLTSATGRVHALLHEPTLRSLPAGRIGQERADWLQQREAEHEVAQVGQGAVNRLRRTPSQPTTGYSSAPDRGRGRGRGIGR